MTTSGPVWVDSITAERPIIGQDMGIERNTFVKAIRNVVVKHPDRVQYVLNDDTRYTLSEFYDLSKTAAKAMIHLGVQPFEGVAIFGFNSIEWFSADVGACIAAAIPAGIYTTNKASVVSYILNHSNCRLIFVDGDITLKKVLSIRSECPNLIKIIIWGKYDSNDYPDDSDIILTWQQFLDFASDVSDDQVEERINIPKPENCCKLIYTSGTTGPPKAVMISNDNIVFTSHLFGPEVGVGSGDRMISYLPASHIAANNIDICGAILANVTVYLADSDALKGTLVKTMKKVRPTILVAVPRVYEKIQEGLMKVGAKNGAIKQFIAGWAKDIGRRASRARDEGNSIMPWGYQLADLLVFQNIRKELGLDECRLFINTSAPMQDATDEYFKGLDFRIVDLYGMSEATGPFTLNYPEYRASTSGKTLRGIEVKLDNKDVHGEGELCFRGRNMFMGYLDNPEENAKTFDEDGFLHSGDLGKVDEDGFVRVTGRVKELLVTAGGENVASPAVESTLRSAMSAITRAFAIGDRRKFVSALLIPYVDDDGKLIGDAAKVNPEITTAEEAVKDDTWKKYLEEGVAQANEDAISNVAKVKAYRLLTRDFSVEQGELTPTMKVKRKIVVEKYADLIEDIYKS